MRDRGSQTAEVVALFRALETLESPRVRLFADPYAEGFLRGRGRLLLLLARLPLIRRRIVRIIDRKWPGARTSAVARTRLVDDLLRLALKNDARQVLILGVGFDARAYRIAEIATARVFEVDHPLTQAAKIRLIGRAAPHRAAVTHVPGSELFFTYVHRGLLDGSLQFDGGAEILERVHEVGEPWTCGFEPREMPGYLAARSFALLEDLSADEYRGRYFGDAARSMKGYSFYRAVLARRTA